MWARIDIQLLSSLTVYNFKKVSHSCQKFYPFLRFYYLHSSKTWRSLQLIDLKWLYKNYLDQPCVQSLFSHNLNINRFQNSWEYQPHIWLSVFKSHQFICPLAKILNGKNVRKFAPDSDQEDTSWDYCQQESKICLYLFQGNCF